MKLLLWDIDGTLINTDRAGMHAWLQALEQINGGPVNTRSMKLAGLTDRVIARISIEQILGRPHSDALAAELLDRYVQLLPAWLQRQSRGFVIPGARAILDQARETPEIALALLTGNIEAGGRLKLAHYGLLDYFEWGAFADGDVERRDIARRAAAIAADRYGDALEQIYVIGDTPHDIDCGKAIDARTIAVGTGYCPTSELAAHEPWLLLEAYPAPAAFLARLSG